MRFAFLPGDLLGSLCGDFITEDAGHVLASVCGGELAGIQSLIENESTDEWVRRAALSSLVTLVAAGHRAVTRSCATSPTCFVASWCGSCRTL